MLGADVGAGVLGRKRSGQKRNADASDHGAKRACASRAGPRRGPAPAPGLQCRRGITGCGSIWGPWELPARSGLGLGAALGQSRSCTPTPVHGQGRFWCVGAAPQPFSGKGGSHRQPEPDTDGQAGRANLEPGRRWAGTGRPSASSPIAAQAAGSRPVGRGGPHGDEGQQAPPSAGLQLWETCSESPQTRSTGHMDRALLA